MLRNAVYLLFLTTVAITSCRVMPKPYSLNENVKQDVEGRLADSVMVKPGEIYEAGKFKRFLLGDHYRDTWTTTITVPVLDFTKEKGGLEILDRGGGQQTYSLKLKGGDGQLYSLRSIQKDPSPTLPLPLQYSFADDVVQDQISASHPFGAFILPKLGDAAGIYHTNPKMVFIPDTPLLGEYREDYGGVLAMIEQDADEDWSDYEDFGYTKNAVSSESVMEELQDDNENRVDEKALLRVRLFDMWVGDWDRHDGQFRWAEFEDDRGKYYRPIPEDRDNVFFKFDGFFPWWARRKWALRKFQSFDDEIRDIGGLNHNARYLDRRFLTGLSQADWVDMAKDLQGRLTNDVIKEAVGVLPAQVYKNDGPFLVENLIGRRNNLVEFAKRYYKILAKDVDIVGSDNNEYFVVDYSDQGTKVSVYDASDEGEKKQKIYERIFYYKETDEVRLFARGDEDFIEITGKADKSPKIRFIGGEDMDFVNDSSSVNGWSKNNVIYDNPDGVTFKTESREVKQRLSESLDINRYDFKSFKYNYLGPTVFFGFNEDDGVYLGGGVVITTHGFRKDPYASNHKIAANVAPNTFAWNFDYEGDFKRVIGDLGFNVDLSVKAPNYFSNFYGLGNETVVDESFDDNYYRIRYREVTFFPGITFETGHHALIKLGPAYQYVKVNSETDKFINVIGSSIDPRIFSGSHFGGAKITADIKTVENTIYPEKGIHWKTEFTWQAELNNSNRKYSQLKSELSAYYSFEEPTLITLASRIGGASNAGRFAIYQGNTIGGNGGLGRKGNVRGYERDRFTGRSSLYNNNEVRVRLARIPFYYMPLAVGISAHFDQGRVWVDNEDSDEWYTGYGGGLWFNPLGKWVFTTTYTKSEEDDQFMLNLGFMF
ncbi:MAG: hypothetical protein ABJH05_01015 [Fulvivirga sp.]